MNMVIMYLVDYLSAEIVGDNLKTVPISTPTDTNPAYPMITQCQ